MSDNFQMDYPLVLARQLQHHLRSLRKMRGLTQAELAQRLGVVQSRVADIEANPGAVSLDQLMRVLAALDAQLVVRDLQALKTTGAPLSGGQATSKVSSSSAKAASTAQDKNNSPKGRW